MNNAQPLFLLVIGFAICMGFALLIIAGGGVLIFVLGRRVVAPMRQRQLEGMVEDWAQEEGCELLDLAEVRSRNHPFADRFGFGLGKVPGVVKQIKVRDDRGRVRRGWVFVRVRLGPKGSSSFVPGSVEVAWDD